MKNKIALALIATTVALTPSSLLAKGCLRGAAAGAVAGHYAHHHAIMGAMAGCAAGHMYYKHKATVSKRTTTTAPSQ